MVTFFLNYLENGNKNEKDEEEDEGETFVPPLYLDLPIGMVLVSMFHFKYYHR